MSQSEISPPANGGRSESSGGYRRLKFRIVGVSPMLHHSSRLVDPFNAVTKELKRVSKKRAKTEADLEEMARLEFTGGLWLDGGEPCIPGEAIEGALVTAARKSKRGVQARLGLMSPANWPLIYDGPREPAELWEDQRFRFVVPVRVGNARVVRTRPIFRAWEAEVEIHYIDDVFDASDIVELLATAGRIVGIGDWRPRFGRFEIQS